MIATYRLQLHPDFRFEHVQDLLPYFRQLGVSHLYLSPINEARPGSTHGYDVIDHNLVREDLGGRAAFEELAAAAHAHGLGLVLDFVPNHAGVGPHNASWQDVLAYGPHSPYAPYFDVDWSPLKPELQGKILLPFLGRPYGEVLDDGELSVRFHEGQFVLAYFENRYALTPRTYAQLLDPLLPAYERTDTYWDLRDLRDAYGSLNARDREKAETLALRLQRLDVPWDEMLATLPAEALHALLEQQYWRLSYWQTAGSEINYRRFFDINELVALRMEDPQVFWDAHRLLADLLALDGVHGVRIDHIDGLFDPQGYLERLQRLGARHVWVEKILAPGETLPDGWPVEGATGYVFMNDVLGVLLHPEAEQSLDRTYRRYVDQPVPFEEVVYESKRLVMQTSLNSELFRLAYELDRLSEADYHTRDFTLEALRQALAEVVAAFDRYRTYLPRHPDDAREVIQEALHRAARHNPALERSVFRFIEHVLMGEMPPALSAQRDAWVGRFQQYTAPVAAKGVEDTAFYRYVRLAACNEVGGEPGHFGQTAHAFHAHARFRAHRYPRNLLATATHDHKRGEDTRMRLATLTEMPDAWADVVQHLDAWTDAHRQDAGPAPADVYLFYQLLAALWPDADRAELPDRLWAYMQKAAREAKVHTSWINPDEPYETSLEAFVRAVLEDPRLPETLDAFAEALAERARRKTLTQVVLKTTSPGVPDFYQGTELLDTSLVDPDNRRPVDYARRQALLQHLDAWCEAPTPEAAALLRDGDAEQAKYYLTARLLRFRNAHPALFADGSYLALDLDEACGWLAFARLHEEATLLVCVPRFGEAARPALPLPEPLRARTWTDVLTGDELSLDDTVSPDAGALPWLVLHAPA